MKLTATITLTLALTAAGFASPAFAKTVPIQGKDKVEGRCGQSGGVYFPPSKTNSTYGCMNGDGSGIVCSGVTQAQKKTCDTFLKLPPRLPTRAQVLKAEKNAKK